MAIFNQQGQNVNGVQQNAETININNQNISDTLNVGEIKTKEDFRKELDALYKEIARLSEKNDLEEDEETVIEAKSSLELALSQAKKEEPDPSKLESYLNKANTLVSGVTALASLAAPLGNLLAAIPLFS